MNNWVKVFGSNQLIEAEMIKSLLLENDIEAILINKIDSSYLFGQAEIFCLPDDVLAAKKLILTYFEPNE
ncbi:MAG: DUF2007 domain-containing protein [Bacteroidia bacterium]